MEKWREDLYHHGIRGQKWGVRNGPPYPLRPGAHSRSEEKAGWKKSLIGNGKESTKVKRLKTPTDNVGAVKSKGLTDGQKKALIIGASAVAVGLAAYGGFKLYQQYGEAKYFLNNVETAKQYLDFQKNTSLKELANNIGDDTLYEWRRESAIDDLNKAKERIDAIQVPINNPFLKKIPDYSKGVNMTPSEIKENLLKEVTQAYKEIGDLDSSRQAEVLNQIKQEYTKIPKESINNIVKEYESVPAFKELDELTKELIEKNASALGI